MPSGTNLELKRRKLERLVRRAFKGEDSRLYTDAARNYRGSASHLLVGNALMRDILKTLDELEELEP